MAATTHDLVDAVATAVGALTGWTRSTFAPGLFGRDPDRRVHKSFAVSAPESAPEQRELRQVPAQGGWFGTIVVVEWAYRLRGDAQVADYAAALDAEVDMVGAVMGVTNQAAVVQRLGRRVVAEGWVIGEARFLLPHRYSLNGLPPSP